MSFLFPGFLFALAAVGIPVIIHLFRFRRFTTEFFPNIAFLRQLSEVSDKESRLKHLLVLMARILFLVFLVMAFSRPYIPADEEQISPEGNTVGVYVDNSFSMNALSPAGGSLLDEAKSRALEIASVYGPTDRFLLLTNDMEGRHQRFVSRDEFVNLVQEIEPSATVRSVHAISERKRELFGGEMIGSKRAYYISDFQKSTSGLDAMASDPDPRAFFIPLRAQQPDNVFIDSAWVDSPVILEGQPATIGVRIANDGSQNLDNQPLRLSVGGRQRSVVSYSIGPGEEQELEIAFSPGEGIFQQGYLEITDYPVTFDDRLFFSLQITSSIPVLCLEAEGRNPYLYALYGREDLFDYHTMPAFSIDYSVFSEYNTIILDAFDRVSAGLATELQRFVEAGGSLVVFPGKEADLASFNEFLRRMKLDTYARSDTTSMRVRSLNEQHAVFDNVFDHIPEQIDLPRVSRHYAISRTLGSMGEDLMELQSGLPFLASYPAGDGRVFLSSVPLDDRFSNFQRHSLFVPVMANIALQSGYLQPLYHTMGDGRPVVLAASRGSADQVYRLRREGFEVIPEQRRSGNQVHLFFHDQVRRAGNYALYFGDEHHGVLSFNYDRRASLMEFYSPSELEDVLADMQIKTVQIVDAGEKPLDQVLQEAGMGRQLWRLFLMIALLFLLAEVLILRFWK